MQEKLRTIGDGKYTPVSSIQMENIEVPALPPDIFTQIANIYGITHYDKEELERCSVFDNNDGTRLYVLEEKGHNLDRGVVHRTNFVDYVGDTYAGFLLIQFETVAEMSRDTGRLSGVPHVVDTQTRHSKGTEDLDFRLRGLATRRLIAANAYSIQKLHKPLYSGRLFLSHWAKKIWLNLVRTGAAEESEVQGHEFRFKEHI